MTIQFFETAIGRRFFESTMPQLVKVLGKIAENLGTEQPASGSEIQGEPQNRSNEIGDLIQRLEGLIRTEYGIIKQEDGERDADAWMSMVQGMVTDSIGSLETDGRTQVAEILAVRRGFKKAAIFARTFTDFRPVPLIHMSIQRRVLESFAVFLMEQSKAFGSHNTDTDTQGK